MPRSPKPAEDRWPRTSVSWPPKLLEELRQAAAEDYQQEAELVRAAVRDYLRARERTKREGG